MEIKDSYNEIFKNVNKILAVLAHPDDMEIICGGLLARLTADSKKVRLVVTTNGGKGVKDKTGLTENEFGKQRVQEQIIAGKELGILPAENFNLDISDGELEPTVKNIGKVAFHVREFKPDLVITHNPENIMINFFNKSAWVNHRDHRNTGVITMDACYPYSRDRNFFPEHFKNKDLAPHSVTKVLLADSYTTDRVTYFAIDNYLKQKSQALQKHISAFAPEDADDYIEENKMENGYFEPLGYWEIY